MNRLTRVLMCVALLSSSAALAVEPLPKREWSLPMIGAGEFSAEHVASICANRAQKKLYVGVLSRDAARTGLWVYDLDEKGQPTHLLTRSVSEGVRPDSIAQPRKYSDHPDPLPVGQHSTPVCLLLDAANRKLFLGVHGSHPTHARALVMYSLDERGDPTGQPEAFDHGNVNKACDELRLHPQSKKLLAVGWGGEGFFVVDRDANGRPTSKGIQQRFGGYGSSSFGLRSDASKLYRGTYPSVIEVCDLDAQGQLVGAARSTKIPNGPQAYAKIVVTDRAIYFVGPDQRLSWFALDDNGEISGEMHSADIPQLQAVAASDRPNHLLVAIATGFEDAFGGKSIVDGVTVREVALNADGSPGTMTRQTAPFARAEAVSLSGGANSALAAKSLGRGFLGNRLAGLKVRCSIVDLEADGVPLPAMQPVSVSKEAGYLTFAVSKKRGVVYAAGKDELVAVAVGRTLLSVSANGAASSGEDSKTTGKSAHPTTRIGCPGAAGPVVVDDKRGLLFAALKDGTIALRKLDGSGLPTNDGETLKTSLSSIDVLAVHATSGRVFAVGAASGQQVDEPRVVPVIIGTWGIAAVVDEWRGRLYVTEQYRGHDNLSVWKLAADGSLAEADPNRFADGIPVEKPDVRGMLYDLKLDAERRKLYVGGAQENPTTQPAFLIVWDLDEHGDPIATSRRLLQSPNARGSCQAVEISADRKWLYESGWGESRIFVRSLDERGEPSRDAVVWNVGTYGKRQLAFLPSLNAAGKDAPSQSSLLLAGTHPSELEVLSLQTPSNPLPAAHVELSCEALHVKLGLLSKGQTTEWVDLDAALKNGIGPTVARVTLSGAPVKRATLQWDVARQVGEQLEPVRSVKLELIGNVGALIVPKYGTDAVSDLTALPSLIKTSAEEFARYRKMAVEHTVSPSERPQQFGVANGLIGLDSSGEALDAGMETLALLGHNTAQIWNWPGVAPEKIRETALKYGIKRFRTAIYNPPSYFHFNTELVKPESLDKWAAGFRETAASMGAKPEEVELMHIGDEPGWYFPQVTDDVRNDPQRLAVFREYLRSKGLTPADVGATTWEEVLPGKLSAARPRPGEPQGASLRANSGDNSATNNGAATNNAPAASAVPLTQRRLFYWTTRFYAESLSLSFAAATQALQRQLNPKLLTTMNLNNWPGRFYIASPGVKLANNSDAGPDAGMGMPDWFDLGRKKAISCIWTEDWFGDADAQLWSFYGDLLRCSAREGGIEYGGYPVGQSTGAMKDGAKLKIAALVGHGAKTIDPYIFGPNLAFADGWSEKAVTYRNLSEAMRVIGKAERVLAPGRPRDASIAIVFPQASQVWDEAAPSNCYLQELYGLHAALIHSQLPVDFIDDYGLEADDLVSGETQAAGQETNSPRPGTPGRGVRGEGQIGVAPNPSTPAPLPGAPGQGEQDPQRALSGSQNGRAERHYSTIFVTAPNLSIKAQRALKQWCESGCTLVLSPGACAADEYNEPTNELRSLIGATQAAVPRVPPPHPVLAPRIRETGTLIKRVSNDALNGALPAETFGVTQITPLKVDRARALLTLPDESACLTETPLGKGRLLALGFWPGVTYWLSPDRTDHSRLPSNWATSVRQVIASCAAPSSSPLLKSRDGIATYSSLRPVLVSAAGVEACLLKSEAGTAITLLNWTGRPIPVIKVTVPGVNSKPHLTSIEHGPLPSSLTTAGLELTLPLESVDIILLEKP